MSEYILFWLSKFIAELLWTIIVLFCTFVVLLLLAIYNTSQKRRKNRVKIKKENTTDRSHDG